MIFTEKEHFISVCCFRLFNEDGEKPEVKAEADVMLNQGSK